MSRAYVPTELRRQVREDARARCGYCHTPEAFLGMPLDIEHLTPEAAGGPTTRENLWLACTRCNDFKGDRIEAADPVSGEIVALYNPRTQSRLAASGSRPAAGRRLRISRSDAVFVPQTCGGGGQPRARKGWGARQR